MVYRGSPRIANRPAGAMSEKFAGACGLIRSEFLDLNHTSNSMILVSLVIPKFAPSPAQNTGGLRNRDTRGVSRLFGDGAMGGRVGLQLWPDKLSQSQHRHPRTE